MHPNPAFRKADTARNIAFARERSFGILSLNADPAPLLSHIPFQLSPDGTRLEAHLVRSNPILKLMTHPHTAVLAVSGGDSYISPDWYGVEQQVPTWNYVAVHLRGMLHRLPDSDLHGILDRLSANMESRLLPKPVWTLDKLTGETISKMSRMIVPIAMEIEQIDGTWKLAQNKPTEAIDGAADGAEQAQIGAFISELAGLMRKPPE
ncbi:MAG: FMN-binding negative transcriptional regulator [Rhodobacteraceae bacterium]|nr:FMN-binding negative transcriptional regulator [Paracoccaceae bacterium]